MAGQFHKDPQLKYTDMCIYIDANLDKIVVNGENPEIESKIYEYLYHILYALACKANFFPNFEDYNAFAMFGAGELYISLRNKQINAGKVVRGKEVLPIKSSLNYIKSVLFPLKVNYTRQNFAGVFNPELGHNTEKMIENLKESVRAQYRTDLQEDLEELLNNLPNTVHRIIWQTPYKKDPVMLNRLYISCVLTFINDITLPNKIKNKLNKSKKVMEDTKLLNLYKNTCDEVILWHIPLSLKDYVRLLVKKIKIQLSNDLDRARTENDLEDDVVDNIIKTAYAQYDDTGDF